jgi:hypothetical protein
MKDDMNEATTLSRHLAMRNDGALACIATAPTPSETETDNPSLRGRDQETDKR